MKEGAASAENLTQPKEKTFRSRSLPSRRSYDVAVLFSALHYFGIILTVTALVRFFIEPSMLATKFITGGLGFTAATWFIAFFKRRATHCPLCKGTPLIASGALAHSKAIKIPPFNAGVTATLSIIATQKFRCMYCGSDYDLLKKPSYMLTADQTENHYRP